MLGIHAEQAYRSPAVAGLFYPNAPDAIDQTLRAWFGHFEENRQRWRAAMLPHAGWIYSGRIAAQVFAEIEIPSTVVFLCPKHGPGGASWAVAPWEKWLFPGGEVDADLELSRALASQVPDLEMDARPHATEHAIEVHLPLLAYRQPRARIVAITVGSSDIESCGRFAQAMAETVRPRIDSLLFVISSDMHHFADDTENQRLDKLALRQLEQLDPDGLYSVCRQHHITMCGMSAAVIVLKTLQELGLLQRAKRVAYSTSASVSGETERVVGYAGMLFG